MSSCPSLVYHGHPDGLHPQRVGTLRVLARCARPAHCVRSLLASLAELASRARFASRTELAPLAGRAASLGCQAFRGAICNRKEGPWLRPTSPCKFDRQF